MPSFFITGTDTDCGKTYVTCQLLDYFNHQGMTTQAIKPIASGCVMQYGRLISEDVTCLQRHNADSKQIINRWAYLEPIAPHLAAGLHGERLSAKDVVTFCSDSSYQRFDNLLIEGAGGLLVPLNEDETWLDVLRLSHNPVILVVGMRLGCINHALLTDAVLKINGIACVGWVANQLDNDMVFFDENLHTLREKMHMPLIATVSYCGKIQEIDHVLRSFIDADL